MKSVSLGNKKKRNVIKRKYLLTFEYVQVCVR